MYNYITRRLIQSAVVIFIVTVLVFAGMRLLPGDPIFMLFNPNELQNMTHEEIEKIRHDAGLDRSLAIQYFDWLGGVFRGNLGESILTKEPVTKVLMKRIPITGYIGALSFIIAISLGVPAGIISAIRRGI